MSNLYIIPTPIGNVSDITHRAVEVLTSTKIILCEDTRVTYRLFKELKIDSSDKKLFPYHDHNEREKMDKIIDLLNQNIDIAMVSDAGTPLINDPGFSIVREIRGNSNKYKEINLVVLPGANSITTALVNSGFPTDKFTFLGYLTRKMTERVSLFLNIQENSKNIKQTYICFETPHRILESLIDFQKTFGDDLSICLCKEMTKKHEKIWRGKISDLLDDIKNKKIEIKGEMVLVFNPTFEID